MSQSTQRKRIDEDQVKVAALGRCNAILIALGFPEEHLASSPERACPKCGGNTRYRAFDDVNDTGGVFCSHCHKDRNGDIFATLMWWYGCNFKKALEEVAQQVGFDVDELAPTRSSLMSGISQILLQNSADFFQPWANKKPPTTVAAIEAAGAIPASWPKSNQYGRPCIAFPAYRTGSEPSAIMLVRRDASEFPAFKHLNARKTHLLKGSKPGWHHVGGIDRTKSATSIWRVEGVPDALALFPHLPSDHAVVSPSHGCKWPASKSKQPPLKLFKNKTVFSVGDADVPGQDGAQGFATDVAAVANDVRLPQLPYTVEESGGKDLRDFFLEGHSFEELMTLATSSPVIEAPQATALGLIGGAPPSGEIPFELPANCIQLVYEEQDVNDEVVRYLSQLNILYSHNSSLVQVQDGKVIRYSLATLRELIANKLIFVCELTEETEQSIREGKTELEEYRQRPPKWCFEAILSRGHWPDLPNLRGVVCSPVLRPDGTVLQTEGYDPASELFAHFSDVFDPVPDHPTSDEIKVAVAELLDVVVDFPFQSDEHRAAWVASVLTPLAREAYQGCTGPLFLFDANVRGSGKSLLADLVSLIVTGREAVRFTAPANDEEARKRITAMVETSDRVILIDNIVGKFGCASLDAALTGTIWKDRRLGHTSMVEAPLSMTWLASGNNVILAADTSRRVCHIRLQSPLENPEEREGFQHTNIRKYVCQNRPRILKAALTILVGYIAAGKPDQKLKSWGSFEGWSDLVRSAVVYAGLPDPGQTRDELRETSDSEAGAIRQMIEAIGRIDVDGHGLRSSDLLKIARGKDASYGRDEKQALSDAIESLCGRSIDRVNTSSLGNRLSHFRNRVVNGVQLDCMPRRGTNYWFVSALRGGPGGLEDTEWVNDLF